MREQYFESLGRVAEEQKAGASSRHGSPRSFYRHSGFDESVAMCLGISDSVLYGGKESPSLPPDPSSSSSP